MSQFFLPILLGIRWPKYWSFSFNISLSNELSGLIPFRMDWLDCLAVQGTLTSLLQHHISKASILQCSIFFTVQLSHVFMNIGETIDLTGWTFVGKGNISLLFNMLCRVVIPFIQGVSVFWFYGWEAICSDFGAPKNKVCHDFQFPHLFAMRWWDQVPWS